MVRKRTKPPRPRGIKSNTRRRGTMRRGAQRLLKHTPSQEEMTKTILNLKKYGGRAAALLAVSYLDHYLQQFLETLFVELTEDQKDRLFSSEANGILGTFSQKVYVAYALGIFGPDVFHDLRAMNTIRNAIAHSKQSVDFKSADIRADCKKLKSLRIQWRMAQAGEPRSKKAIDVFVETASMLAVQFEIKRFRLSSARAINESGSLPTVTLSGSLFNPVEPLTIFERDREFLS